MVLNTMAKHSWVSVLFLKSMQLKVKGEFQKIWLDEDRDATNKTFNVLLAKGFQPIFCKNEEPREKAKRAVLVFYVFPLTHFAL
ncbi:MAG: hypothetical protein ACTS78_02265 [Arsenophonus sp. NC-WZS1-MAG3]